jgi:hypothetical protein
MARHFTEIAEQVECRHIRRGVAAEAKFSEAVPTFECSDIPEGEPILRAELIRRPGVGASSFRYNAAL